MGLRISRESAWQARDGEHPCFLRTANVGFPPLPISAAKGEGGGLVQDCSSPFYLRTEP